MKQTTIKDLIAQACSEVNATYIHHDNHAYWSGRLDGVRLADQCRLTDAETAVIEAALAMTGPRSPGLAWALGALREERGLEAPAVSSLDTRQTAGKVIADGYRASSCDDCGSECHATDSVYCPVRQQDDRDD